MICAVVGPVDLHPLVADMDIQGLPLPSDEFIEQKAQRLQSFLADSAYQQQQAAGGGRQGGREKAKVPGRHERTDNSNTTNINHSSWGGRRNGHDAGIVIVFIVAVAAVIAVWRFWPRIKGLWRIDLPLGDGAPLYRRLFAAAKAVAQGRCPISGTTTTTQIEPTTTTPPTSDGGGNTTIIIIICLLFLVAAAIVVACYWPRIKDWMNRRSDVEAKLPMTIAMKVQRKGHAKRLPRQSKCNSLPLGRRRLSDGTIGVSNCTEANANQQNGSEREFVPSTYMGAAT
ncbi:hypothetical protein niasHS_016583 [Heterodera schachtii]|uniref:Uncharacterized protein n=1 Tax=Heterodera schachtii TaxID=97005 RepID=A0ABD2HXJ3_HETSC